MTPTHSEDLRRLAHASLCDLVVAWTPAMQAAVGALSCALSEIADELPGELIAALSPVAQTAEFSGAIEPPGALGRRLAAVAQATGEAQAVRLHLVVVSAATAEAERLAPLAAALDLALDALGLAPQPRTVDQLSQVEEALLSAGPATTEAPAPLSLGPGRLAGVLGLPLVETALCGAATIRTERLEELVTAAMPPRATRDAGLRAWSEYALSRLLVPLEGALLGSALSDAA